MVGDLYTAEGQLRIPETHEFPNQSSVIDFFTELQNLFLPLAKTFVYNHPPNARETSFEASDLYQMALLNFLRKIETFRKNQHWFNGYYSRAMKNLYLTYLKSKTVKQGNIGGEIDFNNEDKIISINGEITPADLHFDIKTLEAEILSFVGTLGELQSLVFRKFYLEGEPLIQIAREAGTSYGSAKQSKHEVDKKLKYKFGAKVNKLLGLGNKIKDSKKYKEKESL